MADADFLTALQNATQAFNTLSRTMQVLQGVATTTAVSASTVVTKKPGRVAYL